MNILITGSNGFIAKKLIEHLVVLDDVTILTYTRSSNFDDLREKISQSDFIFHLAGVNRAESNNDFVEGNVNLTLKICNYVSELKSSVPIYFSSSIHAVTPTQYGVTKLAAEAALLDLRNKNGNHVIIHRLSRIFGPGVKPHYNSVVATFCHEIVSGKQLQISNDKELIGLMYVDDLIKSMIMCIENPRFLPVDRVYEISIGDLAKLITQLGFNSEKILMVDEYFFACLRETFLYYMNRSSPE